MTVGKIGNIDLVKQLNGATVYRLIDQEGPISRIQIAEISQLAPASITKFTRKLLERGLIKEVEQQASTGGRRPISLTTSNDNFHSIAIRIGRNDIQLSLYDLNSQELAGEQHKFIYTNQDDLLSGVITHIDQFIKNHQKLLKEFIGISVVLPGLVNPDTGVISYMPNTKIDHLPMQDALENYFNVCCFIGNDIRSLALAEHYFGASQDCMDSLMVSVHNGTGAGIMVNGQVFLGHKKNVGEIGHIQVDPLGAQCQCGSFGCLETIASNPAIIARIEYLLAKGHSSSLSDLVSSTILPSTTSSSSSTTTALTIETICQHANQGDELAIQVLTNVGNYLGKAIAITINLFNPEKVVITGDIMASRHIIFQAIQHHIEHYSLPSFHQNMPIVASALNHRPTIGAFAIIKRAMLNGVLLQKLLGKDED